MRVIRLNQPALLALAFAALATSILVREKLVVHQPDQVDALLETPLVPASVVRLMSLGFESALADLSYLKAIQLFGEKRFERDQESLLVRSAAVARLLEHTTDLDPRFDYAYIFGAYTIPVPDTDYRVHNADLAINLLRKGTTNGGDDWRIPFNQAYLHSTWGEFTLAAEAMNEAARRPKGPQYLPFLASRMAAQGGSVETGIAMTQAMLDAAATDEQREQLLERLQMLVMEREIQTIEQAIERFKAAQGRGPETLDELVSTGTLARLPDEPHEGNWVFDAETGEVSSDAAPRLRISENFLYELRKAKILDDPSDSDVAETHPTTEPTTP